MDIYSSLISKKMLRIKALPILSVLSRFHLQCLYLSYKFCSLLKCHPRVHFVVFSLWHDAVVSVLITGIDSVLYTSICRSQTCFRYG